MSAPLRPTATKHDGRRDQLAESALVTLGELGFARTSLREIAANSPFSHGVVHYYFASKSELITYCVRYYKTKCATRYDEVVATSTTADELAVGFIDKMVESLVGDAAMHRLWYDLRTAALFEMDLREAVVEIDQLLEAMVDRILTRFCELAGVSPAFDTGTTYAVLDGIFERALTAFTMTDPAVAAQGLRASITAILPSLVRA